jgi:hypothetical protein
LNVCFCAHGAQSKRRPSKIGAGFEPQFSQAVVVFISSLYLERRRGVSFCRLRLRGGV